MNPCEAGARGNVNYGRGITATRLLRAVSKRELARRVGVVPSYVTHIEAGRKKPSLDVLERIAAALKISLSQLIAICEGES